MGVLGSFLTPVEKIYVTTLFLAYDVLFINIFYQNNITIASLNLSVFLIHKIKFIKIHLIYSIITMYCNQDKCL